MLYDAFILCSLTAQMVDVCECISGKYLFTDEQFKQANNRVCGNASAPKNDGTSKVTYDIPLSVRSLQCSYDQETLSQLTVDCIAECHYPCNEIQYDIKVSSAGVWPNPNFLPAFYQAYIFNRTFAEDFGDAYSEIIAEKNANKITAVRHK